jgi:hypothetical protein
MPLDFIVNQNLISTPGSLQVAGNAFIGTLCDQMSNATPQAVATGTAVILIPAGTDLVRISAAAATTGATLPLGTVQGQTLTIIITTAAANTVTFAAAGTSFVAGGAAVSLAGLAAHTFKWDIVGQLWYQVGPLAN